MPASVQNYEATVTMFQKYTFLSRDKHLDWRIASITKFQFPDIPPVNTVILRNYSKLFAVVTVTIHLIIHSLIFIQYMKITTLLTKVIYMCFHIWHVWWYDRCDDWFWFCLRHLCFWLAMLQPLTPSRLVPSLPCHCTDQFPFISLFLFVGGGMDNGRGRGINIQVCCHSSTLHPPPTTKFTHMKPELNAFSALLSEKGAWMGSWSVMVHFNWSRMYIQMSNVL